MKIKKFITVLGIAAMAAIPCCAQSDVAPFEFDVKVGTNLPLNGESGLSNKLGIGFGLESRWNLKRLPMDIGAELYLGSAVRHGSEGGTFSNRTISLAVVSDYQMNRGSKVSPFIGLGIGAANCEND